MLRYLFLLLLCCKSAFCISQRIVTAGSAVTETVCALGDCDKIVATDRTSLYPERVTSLPSIGYRSGIKAEGIISLRPTLFIVEKNYADPIVIEQVRSAGVKVLEIERDYNFEGTTKLIKSVGLELGRTTEANELLLTIESSLREAQKIASSSKSAPRVLCIYNRGTSSFDVAGTNTFSEMLSLVNAIPAITGVDGYKALNAEALVASNPDFILLFESGMKSLGGIDGALSVTGVAQTVAGKKKQIISMEGSKLSNFGPRLGDAAKELAILIHQPKTN